MERISRVYFFGKHQALTDEELQKIDFEKCCDEFVEKTIAERLFIASFREAVIDGDMTSSSDNLYFGRPEVIDAAASMHETFLTGGQPEQALMAGVLNRGIKICHLEFILNRDFYILRGEKAAHYDLTVKDLARRRQGRVEKTLRRLISLFAPTKALRKRIRGQG